MSQGNRTREILFDKWMAGVSIVLAVGSFGGVIWFAIQGDWMRVLVWTIFIATFTFSAVASAMRIDTWRRIERMEQR